MSYTQYPHLLYGNHPYRMEWMRLKEAFSTWREELKEGYNLCAFKHTGKVPLSSETVKSSPPQSNSQDCNVLFAAKGRKCSCTMLWLLLPLMGSAGPDWGLTHTPLLPVQCLSERKSLLIHDIK